MSRILLIEPHPMLRYAFIVALCLEHQVEIAEHVPEQCALKEMELVIVDAAALRGRNALAASELSAVRSWKVPTIWIDDDADAQAPARESLLRFTAPLDKEALRKVIAQGLAKVDLLSRTDSKPRSQAESPAAAKGQPTETKSSPSNTNAANRFIELTDVVE
jgi:DNA-binding NarL/FixJ family response regulator